MRFDMSNRVVGQTPIDRNDHVIQCKHVAVSFIVYTRKHKHTLAQYNHLYLAVVVNRDLVHRSIGSFVPARWWTIAR